MSREIIDEEKKKELINEIALKVVKDMEKGEKPSISMLFEELINGIMKCEQDKYLNEEGKVDNANGYYNRTLSLSVGRLNLKVPRVRYGMSNIAWEVETCG